MLTLCEGLDSVTTVEMFPTHFPRGVIRPLYEAARGGNELPITYQIATDLNGLLHSGKDTIAIGTGTWDADKFPVGESDGPIGTAALAWGLNNLGWHVTVLAEPEVKNAMNVLLDSLGASIDVVALDREHPENNLALVEQFAAAVFIEKPGSSKLGRFHSVLGYGKGPNSASELHEFVEMMNRQGKVTIGIGDGGNEIGFGKIYEQARDIVPWGKECRCPEKDGIVTRTATKHLYPVGVSNWGAFAIYAALCGLEKSLPPLYTGEMERRLVDLCVELDVRDGGIGTARPYVDGVPVEYDAALVDVLAGLARALHTKESRGF